MKLYRHHYPCAGLSLAHSTFFRNRVSSKRSGPGGDSANKTLVRSVDETARLSVIELCMYDINTDTTFGSCTVVDFGVKTYDQISAADDKAGELKLDMGVETNCYVDT